MSGVIGLRGVVVGSSASSLCRCRTGCLRNQTITALAREKSWKTPREGHARMRSIMLTVEGDQGGVVTVGVRRDRLPGVCGRVASVGGGPGRGRCTGLVEGAAAAEPLWSVSGHAVPVQVLRRAYAAR